MQILIDVLGYLVTGISILCVQFKKKWQIVTGSFFANFIAVISLVLQKGITSAVMVNSVGALQSIVNAVLAYKGKNASKKLMAVFFVLFFTAGIIGYDEFIDVFPIIGSLLFMTGQFQPTEQRMRIVGIVSNLFWISYYTIIGSTIIYSQLFSLVSVVIALYRYRKKA